jgi:hypothetical protein
MNILIVSSQQNAIWVAHNAYLSGVLKMSMTWGSSIPICLIPCDKTPMYCCIQMGLMSPQEMTIRIMPVRHLLNCVECCCFLCHLHNS